MEARWHSGELEEFRALRNVAARPAKFRTIVEHDFVFSVEPRQQLADGVEPHRVSRLMRTNSLGSSEFAERLPEREQPRCMPAVVALEPSRFRCGPRQHISGCDYAFTRGSGGKSSWRDYCQWSLILAEEGESVAARLGEIDGADKCDATRTASAATIAKMITTIS